MMIINKCSISFILITYRRITNRAQIVQNCGQHFKAVHIFLLQTRLWYRKRRYESIILRKGLYFTSYPKVCHHE